MECAKNDLDRANLSPSAEQSAFEDEGNDTYSAAQNISGSTPRNRPSN